MGVCEHPALRGVLAGRLSPAMDSCVETRCVSDSVNTYQVLTGVVP